jgi:ABC-type transport system involved in cytochrome c biogenesis permease subunit
LFAIAGAVGLGATIGWLWIEMERPPLRTLGETRLWYAFLLSLAGIAGKKLWKVDWLLAYSLAMGMLFLWLNIRNPELLDKSLMPALQSPWFVPHVVTYLEAYALLGMASLIGARGLWVYWKDGVDLTPILKKADTIVYLGYGFLTLGLLIGAVWAKEAWGHYWTWDPKETWALLTWMTYLIYIHLRHEHRDLRVMPLGLLVGNFVVLLVCWFGVNYLPTSGASVHTYTQ